MSFQRGVKKRNNKSKRHKKLYQNIMKEEKTWKEN